MTLDPDYQHRAKTALPSAALTRGALNLKFYHLAEPGFPVEPATQTLARSYIETLPQDPADRAGFIILHRCGPSFHFLLLSLWRGNNELWQAVHACTDPADGFAPFDPAYPALGIPRPTFCVWELGIVAHEAGVWQSYLYSPRSSEDVTLWLTNHTNGPV